MNSSPSIRWMDRYIGSFACLILSILGRLSFKKAKRGPFKNILLIELFEMGASIMTSPSIRFIRTQFPEAKIYVLTTQSIRSSWLKISELDPNRVLALKEDGIFSFLFSYLQVLRTLNRIQMDAVIDFELFFRITAIFSFFIKAGKKGGFLRYHLEGLYRGSVYNSGCHFNQNTHIAKNFLALTKTVLGDLDDFPQYKNNLAMEELVLAPYRSQGDALANLKKKIPGFMSGPYLLVAPDVGPNLSVRNYPLDRLSGVLKEILEEYPQYRIGMIGTKENILNCEKLAELVQSDRLASLAGRTTMDELFELLLGAKLLISNDNGPVHFAALTDTPTLALFSTDSPFVYGSLGKCLILYSFYQCSPCIMAYNHKRSDCSDNKCLQAIPVSTVSSFALRILRNDPAIRYQTINNTTPYLY
ncbi:MAG: glycosyltransferase family 9 protein [Aliarcobacter sp.]